MTDQRMTIQRMIGDAQALAMEAGKETNTTEVALVSLALAISASAQVLDELNHTVKILTAAVVKLQENLPDAD